jgi:hypothetical protein
MPYRFDPDATTPKAEFFDIPRPEPQDYWKESASIWPEPTMTTTTVEQLEQKARMDAKQRAAKEDRLSEFLLEDMDSATDSEPNVMSFYNGKSFSEGRAAYNQYRIARGLPPLREGSR